VPETVAGTYAPRLILKYFQMGVKRTYLYELIDDPTWAQPGYGLLNYDGSPKPAYTAIGNLQQIFQDAPTQFTPDMLAYSLSGNTDGVESVLVEKTNGDFYLNVWLGASVYDVNALVDTPQTPQQLTLTLPPGKAVVSVANFNPDGTIAEDSPNQSTYTFNATSCVTTIHIGTVAQPVTATPTISLGSGTYNSAQSLIMSDSTAGAEIYYTTDGTAPTIHSPQYTSPISVATNETIQAIAQAPGFSSSAVASATYAVALAGNYSITAGPGSLTVDSSGSAAATVTVTPENGFNSPVTFACSGLPSGFSCKFAPSTLTPSDGASTTTLTIAPTANAYAADHSAAARFLPVPLLTVFAFCFASKKRRRLLVALVLVTIQMAILLTACGSSASLKGVPTPQVPTVSTITVTATAGTLRHSTTFSLTVQ
jgi:hypothetical protein